MGSNSFAQCYGAIGAVFTCADPGAVSVMLLYVSTPWEIHSCLISASLSLPVCRRCRSSPLELDRFIQPRAHGTFPTSLTCDLCKFKQNFPKWELCEVKHKTFIKKNIFFSLFIYICNAFLHLSQFPSLMS